MLIGLEKKREREGGGKKERYEKRKRGDRGKHFLEGQNSS